MGVFHVCKQASPARRCRLCHSREGGNPEIFGSVHPPGKEQSSKQRPNVTGFLPLRSGFWPQPKKNTRSLSSRPEGRRASAWSPEICSGSRTRPSRGPKWTWDWLGMARGVTLSRGDLSAAVEMTETKWAQENNILHLCSAGMTKSLRCPRNTPLRNLPIKMNRTRHL